MIRALVVTHGELGSALVEVVQHFLGPQKGLAARSNAGLSAPDLVLALERDLAEEPAGGAVFLFSDLVGGSCDAACRAVCASRAACVAVSGVNLPMLLEFCHYRHRLEPDVLLERITAKARAGIHTVRGDGAASCP